jgi:hypothetical protein
MSFWWLVRFMMANGGIHYIKTLGQAASRVLTKAGYDPRTMANQMGDSISGKFKEPVSMPYDDALKTLHLTAPYSKEELDKQFDKLFTLNDPVHGGSFFIA